MVHLFRSKCSTFFGLLFFICLFLFYSFDLDFFLYYSFLFLFRSSSYYTFLFFFFFVRALIILFFSFYYRTLILLYLITFSFSFFFLFLFCWIFKPGWIWTNDWLLMRRSLFLWVTSLYGTYWNRTNATSLQKKYSAPKLTSLFSYGCRLHLFRLSLFPFSLSFLG